VGTWLGSLTLLHSNADDPAIQLALYKR